MLMHLAESEADTVEDELKAIGQLLISFVTSFNPDDFPEHDFVSIITSSLNSLKFVAQMDSEFTTERIGELLGITRSFILYSIPDISQQPPSKIASSQQAIMEPLSLRPNNKRGNGAAAKSKRSRRTNKKKPEPSPRQQEDSPRSYGLHDNATSFVPFSPFAAYRTSDSDYSDNEHNRELVNRHKLSKLRLSALTLLSVIVSSVEKKVLFGYWHSLFSTEESSQSSSSATLINCVLKDPVGRCKILALQNIILLLKNSKPFLIQAENKEKGPTTFTPFSVTLGNMIVFTYEKLTQVMTSRIVYAIKS